MLDFSAVRAQVRRRVGRHRRLLAAALAAGAAAAAISAVSPAPPHLASVVVAAHDIDAGEVLSSGDVAVAEVPAGVVPSHAATTAADVLGRALAAPVRAGEVVTDRRLLGRSLLAGYPADTVAAPVRISDADTVSLLRVGDRIDVYAAVGSGSADPTSPAAVVVAGARIISLPAPTDSSQDGGLVVLAVDQRGAAALAEAGATAPLSVALRR